MKPLVVPLAAALLALAGALAPPSSQIPEEFRNLEVLPEDISRDNFHSRYPVGRGNPPPPTGP